MNDKPLAIASVPVQQWGALYEDKEALQRGTMFEDLYMPFYAGGQDTAKKCGCAAAGPENQDRARLLQEIDEVSFVLDDLALFLDTHETDKQALSLFREKSARRAQLKKEFAAKFYPLTRDCVTDCSEEGPFCWQDGPIPWEGVWA